MKLNLKVRLKNPVFWLTIIPAIITFIYTILGVLGIVPSISQDVIINSITAIISALTTLGVLIDPTTSGMSDSSRALTYTEPIKDVNVEDDEI